MGIEKYFSSTWRSPQTLTFFIEVNDVNVPHLRKALSGKVALPGLKKIPTLHFFRLFVIDPGKDLRDRPFPARLAMSIVFDGKPEDALLEILNSDNLFFDSLFKLCQRRPEFKNISSQVKWLLMNAEKPQTYHIGPISYALSDIRAENDLYKAITRFIDEKDETGFWKQADPQYIHKAIQNFVKSQPNLPEGPKPGISLIARFFKALDFIKTLFLLLAIPLSISLIILGVHAPLITIMGSTFLIFACLIILGFMIVRLYECSEPDVVIKSSYEHIFSLVSKEDFGIQNQFTMLSLTKDSMVRRLLLRFSLWMSNFLSRHFWDRGRLAGIPTIHYARIHQIDEGRRMLFLSDFDGGWGRYLFDFLNVGAVAVIPNWSNLHGCPKARFLLWPTPGFANRFLPFTRAMQLETQIWYSAMEYLSVNEIIQNSKIREGLFKTLDEEAACSWLSLI